MYHKASTEELFIFVREGGFRGVKLDSRGENSQKIYSLN